MSCKSTEQQCFFSLSQGVKVLCRASHRLSQEETGRTRRHRGGKWGPLLTCHSKNMCTAIMSTDPRGLINLWFKSRTNLFTRVFPLKQKRLRYEQNFLIISLCKNLHAHNFLNYWMFSGFVLRVVFGVPTDAQHMYGLFRSQFLFFFLAVLWTCS